MRDASFIEILKSLNRKEFKDLAGFINSPFCYRNYNGSGQKTISRKKIILLFGIIKREYPGFKGIALESGKVFEELYPGQNYDERKIRNIKFEFTKIVENYLSYLNFSESAIQHKFNLLESLAGRNLGDPFMKQLRLTNEALEKCGRKDEEYFYYKYVLAEKGCFFDGRKTDFSNGPESTGWLKESVYFLMNFYVTSSFRQLIYYWNCEYQFSLDFSSAMLETVYNCFRDQTELIDSNINLSIYSKFLSLKGTLLSPEALLDLREDLKAHETNLERRYFSFLYIHLLSLSILGHDRDRKKYNDVLTKVLKDCFDKEVFVKRSGIPEHTYVSLVDIALKLGETGLAEKVINTYKDKLTPEYRGMLITIVMRIYIILSKIILKV